MQVGFNPASCENLETVLEQNAGFTEQACAYTAECADSAHTDAVSNTATYLASMCTNGADDFTIIALCPASGDMINSGDEIYLRTHTGSHIDVEGESVQARYDDQGDWQGLIIEKSDGGAISSGDVVYFRTHTGYHIDVEGESVRARYDDQGAWQEFVIEKENGGDIYVGDTVYLRAHTGKYVDVEGTSVQARYEEMGDWQALIIETTSESIEKHPIMNT